MKKIFLIIIIILLMLITITVIFFYTSSNQEYEVIFSEIEESKEDKLIKIVDAKRSLIYDYDIYYYGIENIKVEYSDKISDLKESLNNGSVNMNEVVSKAQEDYGVGIIQGAVYKDGGTCEYYYENYTIIKLNKISSGVNNKYCKDVYIVRPGIHLGDLKI